MNLTATESSAEQSLPGKQPSLYLALLPVVILIGLLGVNVYFFKDNASYGANQIALLFSAGVAVIAGFSLGIRFKAMLDGIVKSLGSAIGAMLILLVIGSLAGTWMMGGIVPAMIYYGLEVLDPQYFLVASLAICSIVSIATGSSWSTVATVGIALMAIGDAMGISNAMTAGAIISGAYFGDKMSPLSDTTNLASAMAGTELFTHIRYMLWTTVPSILIAVGIFAAIGLSAESSISSSDTEALRQAIAERFHISLWLLLVPAAVIVMVLFKVDALVALFVGALLGAVVAIGFQPDVVKQVSGLDDPVVNEKTETRRDRFYAEHAYAAAVNSMALETRIVSDDELSDAMNVSRQQLLIDRLELSESLEDSDWESFQTYLQKGQFDRDSRVQEVMTMSAEDLQTSETVDQENRDRITGIVSAQALLKGKGMEGMLNTIWLIICAMTFGGVMEGCGMLQRITQPLVNLAKSTGSLIATTAGSCLFINITASDQYLAIVVPGRMFRETYAERGLAPQNLSRTLEDTGTVTSVLVPWNTCGVTQAGVLGVATLAYAPYCFFNLASPVMTLLIGFLGIGIARLATGSNNKQN